MTKFFPIRKFLRDIPIRWKLYIVIFTLLLLMGITIISVVEQKVTSHYQQDHYEDTESIGRMVAANAATTLNLRVIMKTYSISQLARTFGLSRSRIKKLPGSQDASGTLLFIPAHVTANG